MVIQQRICILLTGAKTTLAPQVPLTKIVVFILAISSIDNENTLLVTSHVTHVMEGPHGLNRDYSYHQNRDGYEMGTHLDAPPMLLDVIYRPCGMKSQIWRRARYKLLKCVVFA